MNNKKRKTNADIYLIFSYEFLCIPEPATQRSYYEKVFLKYTANLQKNTRAEVWFQ